MGKEDDLGTLLKQWEGESGSQAVTISARTDIREPVPESVLRNVKPGEAQTWLDSQPSSLPPREPDRPLAWTKFHLAVPIPVPSQPRTGMSRLLSVAANITSLIRIQ